MSSDPSVQPLFVFGALRSGTTLLRLMLRHHSLIQSPGEADFLFDHIELRADGGWQYDIDALQRDRIFWAKDLQLPKGVKDERLAEAIVNELAGPLPSKIITSVSIHRNAPKMATLFPQAKIIHLVRDPRDVARSSIGMGWTGNSFYGVDHWVDTEAGWDAAEVDETKVLTVYFEKLMANLEEELTRICTFLGIEFEPTMLSYYKNTSYGPPDPTIAQKWRKKADPREVALIEGRCAALLEARGYELAGAPAFPTRSEQARLSMQNRLVRWQHNIHRYGFPLFAGHHLARLLGLKGMARKLDERQEAIRIASLK